MKRLYTYLNISFAALLAVMLVACSQKNDYRNILPADSFVVMSANPKSLAHKAQIGDFTQSPIYKAMDHALGEDDMDAADRAYILSLISQPSNTGLDMDNDAFLFITGNGLERGDFEGGLLFKVKSRKDLDKLMDRIREEDDDFETHTENGITIVADAESWHTMAFAYTDDAFLLYFADDDLLTAKEQIKKLFTQKKADSMMGVAHMEHAFNGSNDMLMAMSYAPVWSMVEKQMGGMTGLGFMSKMSVVMPGNFEKGKVVSEARIIFSDKEAEKEFKRLSEFSGPMNGGFLKMLPESNIGIIAGNMNGNKLYEFFKTIPMYSVAFSMVPQLQPVLEAIEGDFVLSFHGMSTDGRMPELSLIAELKDPEVMGTLRGLIPAFVPVSGNETDGYSVDLGGMKAHFGLNGRTLYITTSPAAVPHLAGRESSNFESKWGGSFRNSHGTFIVDFTALRNMFEVLIANRAIDSEVSMALPVIGLFETWEMTSPSNEQANMVLHMSDKSKNAAEVIYKTIEGYAQMAMGFAF